MRRREEEWRTIDCSLHFSSVWRTKEKALFALQEVGVFSSSGYSCLRAIQFPLGSALIVGMVKR